MPRTYIPTGRPRGRPPKYDIEALRPGQRLYVPKTVNRYYIQRQVTRLNARWQAKVGPSERRTANWMVEDVWHAESWIVVRTW